MPQPQLRTSWLIACHSTEEAQALQRWLSGQIALSRALLDTIRTVPNGVESLQSVPHRLGDYFTAIQVLPAPTPSAFRLIFQRMAGAARFWKDLMVNILQEIETHPYKPSITRGPNGHDEGGEKEPSGR